MKPHNNNTLETFYKKAIIQLGLGKLRFVSLWSPETIYCKYFPAIFFVLLESFGRHVYIDGGIVIAFSVVTCSACKARLITDLVNLGTGRRSCFFCNFANHFIT